ncbi:hypothetical protein C1646_755162 [Rhizophagus diaphanus]|nr:hypothetical protein C1646_755162 [Rhizophagus diaphanus] [Rhizophagus sp. MUCL 43196]
MSSLLGSIFGTLGSLFGNFLPSWNRDQPSESHDDTSDNNEDNETSDDISDSSSEYDTADEGENESNEEDLTMIFRLIDNPAPKRLIEAGRVGNNGLCRDYVASIPENYPFIRDPLLMFEDNEKQISEIYSAELQRLGGIKTKIVHIAHMTDTSYTKEEDIAFPSEIIAITRQDRIEEYIAQQYHTILDRIDEMERNAHSGWIYDYGIKVYLEISAYQPLRGASHFDLPKAWAKPQLGIINPKNNDHNCFTNCVSIHLRIHFARLQNIITHNLNDVNRSKRFMTMLNLTGINAPASLRDIDRFEENNPSFAVNVFKPVLSENDKELKTHKLDPLRISEYNYQREHLVDLILFTQGEESLTDRCNINDMNPGGLNTHYCLINGEAGWHRIMRNWNKHHGHKYFCRHCLRAPFSRLDLLEDHIAHNCHGRNNPYAGQREIFPKKGNNVCKFTNIKALLKAPFIIYPDNECDSNKLDEKEEDKNKNTVKIQEQKNNSFGYVLIQNDSDIISNVFRRTANSVEEKWKNMQEDLQMVKEILRNPVELKMIARDWENYNSTRKCYLCDGLLQETRYNKVKYYDNETQIFNGAAHHGCVRTVCNARKIDYKRSLYRTEHLSKKEEKAFNEAAKCVICKGNLKEEKINKVRDHDHITGKYRGAAHRECNLQLRLKPDEIKIPVVYQGGKHYDFHLELLELGIITEEKIEPIADNMENYKSFTIGQFKFIDTIQFQLPSLEKIATNLRGGANNPDELTKRFPILAQCFPKELLPLLTQKSEYPYELNDPDRFSRTKLPSREEFNTVLGGLNYCEQGCKKCKHEIKGKKCDGKCKSEDYKEVTDCEHEKIFTISQKQYDHAQKVWHETGCKTFEDYHMLYLKTDVLILADAFQNFRTVMIDAFRLDPANYITLPSYAFDAAKKITKVELELFHEGQEDMHEFVHRMMRGGNSMAPRRIAKANFPGMKGYNKKQVNKWLLYLDANNLYAWAMIQYLPTGSFHWLDLKDLPNIRNISPTAKRGSAWEVKLRYPKKLHPSHSDFPLCPERRIVTREELSPEQGNMIKKLSNGKFAETEKLVATLETKDRYILHYTNLQQCLNLGMELEHVYRVLEFDQSPWLEPYIMGNTHRRRNAKNAFERDLWKLMNNAVFGKTMEDVRRRKRIDLVRPIGEEHRLRKMLADPALVGRKIFYGSNLIAVHRKQTHVTLNKPIYVGAAILDLSKYYMYDFWYNHIKRKYGKRARLCYTDTDSFIIEIETENIYDDMVEDADLYDFSDYPEDHPLLKKLPADQWITKPDGTRELKNKKVIGKWKDENAGTRITRYAGNRSKSYAVETENATKNIQKSKGLKKSLVNKELTIDIYERCILEGVEDKSRTAVGY